MITNETEQETDDVEFTTRPSTFKEIVITQLGRVVALSNVEFRGGYYTIIPSKKGEDKEVYVPDTREAFSNGLMALALLLKSRFDKEMERAYKTFEEEMDKIREEFIDTSSPSEDVILGEGFYTNSRDKVLFETYKQKKLNLFLSLFGNLCNLLYREKYFEIGSSTY